MEKIIGQKRKITDQEQLFLGQLIAYVLESPDCRLKIDVAAAALGLECVTGCLSHSELAKRNHISRQAFSVHVRNFRHFFNL